MVSKENRKAERPADPPAHLQQEASGLASSTSEAEKTKAQAKGEAGLGEGEEAVCKRFTNQNGGSFHGERQTVDVYPVG